MKVYIDGSAGTTGLQIASRLSDRRDLTLLTLPEDRRRDLNARRDALNNCDIAILCLPDDAAREAVDMIENSGVRVIDASTAHRTAPGWVYGFPELSAAHRAAIASGSRIANPGCHASGFIAIVYPLVAMGILPRSALVTCFSLTGYSGGGKKMIADYRGDDRPWELSSPGIYGLGQSHKHLCEMRVVCGLDTDPVFCPVVDDYYKGMATTVMLHTSLMNTPNTPKSVREMYRDYYKNSQISLVHMDETDIGTLYAGSMSGRDDMSIRVCGNDRRVTVTALFDNLGKGAAGAAVQNLNILMGVDERTGLNI